MNTNEWMQINDWLTTVLKPASSKCPECDDTGMCQNCGGTGTYDLHSRSCKVCQGTGDCVGCYDWKDEDS